MNLSRCCFCVPLRAGALSIGILYLLVNVGVLLGWAGWFFSALGLYNSSDDDESARYVRTIRFSGMVLGGLALICGINITMDSLLVHGVRKNRRALMLPWVIWYGIFKALVSVTLLGVFIWLLAGYIKAMRNPTDGIGIQAAWTITIGCTSGLSLPVMWYWYVCVLSYYKMSAPGNSSLGESPQGQTAGSALLSHPPVEGDSA